MMKDYDIHESSDAVSKPERSGWRDRDWKVNSVLGIMMPNMAK